MIKEYENHPSLSKAGVVIVNYQSPEMAIEAALSALGARGLSQKTQVVIVDNASPDNSFNVMQDILAGVAQGPICQKLPNVQYKPITDISYTCAHYEDGVVKFDRPEHRRNTDVILVKSDRNGGFSYGNNIGLHLLRGLGTDMFVLLNPDTAMTVDTLKAFCLELESDDQLGLVGASLLEHEAPHKAQALGGAYLSSVTLLGHNLGAGRTVEDMPFAEEVILELSYPHGAAMACRKDYLELVGFMDERYFLYYEEADWVAAGKENYRPGWASDAIVYHHRGVVTGSHLKKSMRSNLSDYHMARSRFLYAKKWCPWLIPVLMSVGGVQALRRLIRGQPSQAAALMAGMTGRPLPQLLAE